MPARPEPSLAVEHIVLATDLSCRCDRALARAAELASRWGAPLHIVTAVEEDFHLPSWRSQARSAQESARAELAFQLAERDIAWDLSLVAGPPADAVSELAKRYGSPLVVTGVARNELLGRATPGRTVETLLRRLPAPLLMVRRPVAGPYVRLLHPSDLSPSSARAIRRARAWFPQADLAVLHAYRVPFAGLVTEDAHWREARDQAVGLARAFMARVERDVAPATPPELLVEYGYVEPLVSDFVGARGAELVVVASHLQDGLPYIGGAGHTLGLLMACGADILTLPETAIARAARASG